MEQAQKSWVAKAWALPRKLLTGGIVQVKQRYKQLKNRYGPRYTHAMLIAVFLTFFLPIPGSVLAAVALIVVIAEVHRAISRRGGLHETIANRVVVGRTNLLGWATGRWPRPP